MIPHAPKRLAGHVASSGVLREVGRINSGFYISTCLDLTPHASPMRMAAE
jgi:magnesium-protoporphyrin O-methyltransferase